MVGIQGLGGIPEPKSERIERTRAERENQAREAASRDAGGARDDVQISSEAQAAAEVSRIIQLSKNDGEIRADRVAAAREKIERGEYKDPMVIAKVAERLLKYLT